MVLRPINGDENTPVTRQASNRECQRGSAASTCTKRAVPEADVLRFQGAVVTILHRLPSLKSLSPTPASYTIRKIRSS